MKHLISTKSLAAVAVALSAIVAASSAYARSDVYFSIGLQVPGVYVQPAPVYVQPRQYYAPAPNFYVPAPSYYQRHDNGRRYGQQKWQRNGPYGDRDRDGIANIHDSGNQRNQWRQARLQGPSGDRDRDGDGVRNRYDRAPNNPNRR